MRVAARLCAAALVVGACGACGSSDRQEIPSSRLVFLAARYPDQNLDSIAVANPVSGGCRSRLVPDFGGAPFNVSVRGERFAYEAYSGRGRQIIGRSFGGKVRSFRAAAITAGPVWVAGRIAYANIRRIRFIGGGSITPALPRGASIHELAAHGRSFAVFAAWGGFDLKGALFVVDAGSTKEVAREPFPLGESPGAVGSPDGSRLAILRNGDLWTIRSDGGGEVRLTRLGTRLSPKQGGAIWSSDSRNVAYWSRQGRVWNTYAQPATGGPAHQVTNTRTGRTVPIAWLGDTIAVSRNGVLGLVPADGGKIRTICGSLTPVSGPASWRRR
jgi:hypothetical protein